MVKYGRSGLNPVMALLLLTAALAVVPAAASCEDLQSHLPVVDKIVILGNRSFEDKVLKKRMRTKEARFYNLISKPRYRRDFLRRDIEALKTFYQRSGFFDVTVTLESVARDDKSNKVSIRIMINEGPQTRVRSVTFSDQDLVKASDLRKGLNLLEGKPYNPNLVESDRYSLYSKFFSKGYLAAEIVPKVDIDSIQVDIGWTIRPGDPVKIDSIDVQGNTGVKENLIRRELTIEPGQYFALDRIVDSKQNLYNTGYFNSVEIEPKELDVSSGKVDLLLKVRERKKGYIEAGLGVGNVHANHVFAEWGKRNLLGRGYYMNVRSEFAFTIFSDGDYSFSNIDMKNSYIRHEGEIAFPHVLSTWNTLVLSAFYEKDATVIPTVVKDLSFSGTLSRRFSRHTTFLLGYVYEQIKRQNVVDQKEESMRRSVDASYKRDTRDFYFNPGRGSYASLETRYAGGLLGGDDNYYSVVSTYQHYSGLTKKTIFAWRVRAGYSKAFGESLDTGLPIESRYFLGGANSVRGYEENSISPLGSGGDPIGGGIMALANVELRFPLPWISRYNFGGVAFIDGGNVWNAVDDIKLSGFNPFPSWSDVSEYDFRYSAGFGIRYYTPVGPIRVDVGFPVNRPEGIDHDYWIHISLGQIF